MVVLLTEPHGYNILTGLRGSYTDITSLVVRLTGPDGNTDRTS